MYMLRLPFVRRPFVWEVQVRREVLDEELSRVRTLPYAVWQNVITAPMTKTVTGRDERAYRIRITAEPAGDGSPDIRVTLALSQATGFRRKLMRQTFVVTREGNMRA